MWFIDILFHAVALDIGWFIDMIIGNLLWVFLFTALAFYFVGGDLKKVIYSTIVITLVLFAWTDFGVILGFPIFVGSFLLLNYLVKLGSLSYASSHPALKNRLIFVNNIMAYVAFLVYLVFFAGAS